MQPKAVAAFQNPVVKKQAKKAVPYPLILDKRGAYYLLRLFSSDGLFQNFLCNIKPTSIYSWLKRS